MQIVIDIPEAEYDLIVNDEACGLNVLTRTIAKGTQLPKGHGRLIDVDKLINKASIKLHMFGDIGYIRLDEFARLLDEEAPTIIEADKENKK